MRTKSTGDFGEMLVAWALAKRFEAQRLVVLRVGLDNLPYDLLVPYPVIDSPFHRPTAISIKTRGQWSEVIPPHKEALQRIQNDLRGQGYDFWVGFVKYNFGNELISFEIALTPAERLQTDADFKRVTRRDGPQEQIRTERLVQKALLRFGTPN